MNETKLGILSSGTLCRYSGVSSSGFIAKMLVGYIFLFSGTASKAGNERKRRSLT
jgi:hypothetical protein